MPFHFFGPPPPHILPIVLSSGLAFAGAAFLMARDGVPARIAALAGQARARVASWFSSADERGGLASRMYARSSRTTGNAAFDEYRAATLGTLEAEASEFRDYLDGLRRTRDQAEFEAFVASRKGGKS